jgi:hypothetical protein
MRSERILNIGVFAEAARVTIGAGGSLMARDKSATLLAASREGSRVGHRRLRPLCE